MGRYHQTIKRMTVRAHADLASDRVPENAVFTAPTGHLNTLVPLPSVGEVLGNVTRSEAIRAISERLAPLAAVERTLRLAVAGCRPSDGASTVAVALAMDLSQRMLLRTVLIDAHILRPSLHRVFAFGRAKTAEVMLEGSLQHRSTGWPRLEIASCFVNEGERHPEQALEDFEELIASYQAAVVDLGVPRLDSRLLPLARPTDPVLLVVRYGSTERRELVNTAAALKAANRSIAGVIFNAKTDPLPVTLRRFVRQ